MVVLAWNCTNDPNWPYYVYTRYTLTDRAPGRSGSNKNKSTTINGGQRHPSREPSDSQTVSLHPPPAHRP